MSVTVYKCPSCDATVVFDPVEQAFKCEYCFSVFTEEQMLTEISHEAADDSENSDEGMISYVCKSCGAEMFTDENTVADFCYYCHRPIICEGRLSGDFSPQLIIPFASDKKQAQSKFLDFCKKKWFVPKAFFSKKQIEKIQGVYYPFWVCNADVSAKSKAEAEKEETWTKDNKKYTKTSRYNLYRSAEIHFEKMIFNAFEKEKTEMLEGVLPYPLDAFKTFSPTYLSGFVAKKRVVESDDLAKKAGENIGNYSSQLLRNTMLGYNRVSQQKTEYEINSIEWKYALLPLWLLTYRKNGNVYKYAMNGHTSKIYGKIPISTPKLLILFAIVILAIIIPSIFLGLILPALFVAPAIGGLVMLCVWASYNSGVHGNKYPLNKFSKYKLTKSEDEFVSSSITVKDIPKDSNT